MHRVVHSYLLILYLQIHLFAKSYLCPQIHLCCFHVTHVQSVGNEGPLTCMFPNEVEKCNALPSYFSSHTANKWPLYGLLSATFSHFCAVCWCFCCLKWSRRELEVLPSICKCKESMMCLWRKYMCQISFVQA